MGFKEEKTTQAASLLLTMNRGRMNYMKLLKLLYLIDRRALLTWGRPVTFDRYVSMDHGPVLSITYNMINEGVEPGHESYWMDHIAEKEHYEIALVDDPGTDELSEAEEDLINQVDIEYKDFDQWQLRDITHDLPEWVDPHGSSIPIEIRDILKAGGKSDTEIAAIEEELDALCVLDGLK